MTADPGGAPNVRVGEGYTVGSRAKTLALTAVTAATLAAPLVVAVTAASAADVLLSRNRPVVASSVAGAEYAAGQAIDGSGRTRWASTAGPGTQWLRIDLGGVHRISRVRLVWQAAYARSYQLQTSTDGATWRHLYTTRAGNGGADDLRGLSGSGRYVRVLATQGSPDGYSLWEMQVYGSGPASTGDISAPSAHSAAGLAAPAKKDLAMRLISSFENSSLNWQAQYGYIEDIGDGRGYTAGIIGFCSGTSDMLAVVQEYTRRKPDNLLARYLPALRRVDGSASHTGLDPHFPRDWRRAASDPVFQAVQRAERDEQYLTPALALARADGLRALGQFAYYDAAVMHGVTGLRDIRLVALRAAASPAAGGDEINYLNAFLDARVAEMRTEAAHRDTTRVDTAQRVFLRAANLDLNPPLSWKVYGDSYRIPG